MLPIVFRLIPLLLLLLFNLPIVNLVKADPVFKNTKSLVDFTNKCFQQELASYKIKTVVIDAGHGGHDTGAQGLISLEKTNALSIALKLGKLITQTYPNIRVIYTRTTDKFIPLIKRADIANSNKADLFISIHCNSTRPIRAKVRVSKKGKKPSYKYRLVRNTKVIGTETYVLGLHRSDDNLAVASRENEVVLLEPDNGKQYEKFDFATSEGAIMYSLIANQNLHKSILFAAKVEEQFEQAGRTSRGVQQAGFLVLVQTAMPSVLIETGFITNKKEESLLSTNSGRTSIARSIFKAFKSYKAEVETK